MAPKVAAAAPERWNSKAMELSMTPVCMKKAGTCPMPTSIE